MDSYSDILQRMKEKYTELTGNPVPELSDIDIRMKVLAGEIFNNEVNLEFLKRQMFADTASGKYLEYHADDRGLTRRPAYKASGIVRFSSNEPAAENIIIPAGTIVATTGSAHVRFISDADVTLSAGSYSVGVRCTAEEGGAKGNIAAGTIGIIVTDVAGIDRVANSTAFTGGVDEEDDEGLRRRVLESYRSIANSTNAAYYKKLALSVEGVRSAFVKGRADGVGTVDVYIGGDGTRVSPSTVTEVSRVINRERELNVQTAVFAADIIYVTVGVSITLESGYDFNTVKEEIKAAVAKYISGLEVGESVHKNRLGEVVLDVDGVYDFEYIRVENTNFDIPESGFAVLSSVTVTEAQ